MNGLMWKIIRKIREYNSLRHIKMTPAEIVEDTKKGAAELLARLKEDKMMKVCILKGIAVIA